ncbi:MAG: cytochrome c-type biogenesis protein CcmH [Candidatus Methanoperedens sp.]|nr:cytochrome c-type biogenesis protein CcmH [Candidatus Methanoperedens sp.]
MRDNKSVLKAILLFAPLLTAVSIHTAMAEEDMTPVCPCECAMVISACDCTTAIQVKKEISQMEGTGFSEKQIISALQAEYGGGILVRPEKKDPSPLWIAGILLVPVLMFLGYILARKPDNGIIPAGEEYERQFEEEYQSFVSKQEENVKTGAGMKLAWGIPVFAILLSLYLLSTASAGITGGRDGSPAQEESRAGVNYSIDGHVLSNQSYSIRVVLDHIFISKRNGSLEVAEMVVFRNEGPQIHYSRDNHTFFAISTPPGIKDLKTQAMECCLVEEEGTVLMDPMQPIKPEENFEMKISYTLAPRGLAYVFNKSTVYNTTDLSIFVDKEAGTGIQGSYETVTLNGNRYDVTSFNDLGAGRTVRIPIKIEQEPGYLYAGIGLVLLFSAGLGYHFKGKLTGKREKGYTLPELELEKRRIFQAIYGFEKHEGTERTEEYRRLMEEYRQKAIQIFIRIDKIKTKQKYWR